MYFSIYNFNHSYKEKQNLDWHVGLYTYVMTPWRWHLFPETCSWYVINGVS